MYVNHKTKKVQLTCPSRPNVGEEIHPTDQMPHYRGCMSSLVRYIERHNDLHSKLLQLIQIQNFSADMGKSKRNSALTIELHQNLETNVLDSTHIVMTTLGTSGSKTLERINNFSVIVVDEAAQSCEPSMLPALQLGSQHCVLVGDPQQLPATIFSMSGRSTKYDRSLFQRLEEAGHHVYMLNTQYRMNPMISSFPRRIFYDGSLVDGPNVTKPDYGSDLTIAMRANFRQFQPLTVFDIDSKEERDGTSLYNKTEAHLALHLFTALRETAQIKSRVAIITPYQQQVAYLRRIFQDKFGLSYPKFVDVSTVDAFQGKESSIVILSCVRASAEGGGIGFLSDVQRMNVALTRAKHFLFVLARCESIVVNPYWRDFIDNAREQGAVLRIAPRRTNHHNGGVGRGSNGPPMTSRGGRGGRAGGRDSKRGNGNDLYIFPDLRYIQAPPPSRHLQHF
jgi:senataxin